MDYKILVATHKNVRMPKDKMYMPIFGGEKQDNKMNFNDGMSGENISDKNNNYCELTRMYWAWKNLNADFFGLCQYRRLFTVKNVMQRCSKNKYDLILTSEQLSNILHKSKTTVILPRKRYYVIETVKMQYAHAHNINDLMCVRNIIEEYYPDYIKAFDKQMNKRSTHLSNMFIMDKDNFNKYAEWLFTILFELEKRIDISSYDIQQARVFGLLGERLLDVWISRNNIRYYEINTLFIGKQNWAKKIYSFIIRKYSRKVYENK